MVVMSSAQGLPVLALQEGPAAGKEPNPTCSPSALGTASLLCHRIQRAQCTPRTAAQLPSSPVFQSRVQGHNALCCVPLPPKGNEPRVSCRAAWKDPEQSRHIPAGGDEGGLEAAAPGSRFPTRSLLNWVGAAF